MSRPQTYEATIRIDAPPQRVWQVWADVERWPEWTASITSAEPLDPGPLQLGTRVRVRQPRLPTTVWTVTDFVEEKRFSWTSSTPGTSTVATHALGPEGDGSRVTATIEQGGPLSRVARLVLGSLVERYLVMETEGVKARSEQ